VRKGEEEEKGMEGKGYNEERISRSRRKMRSK
jgi:hypothetical protein